MIRRIRRHKILIAQYGALMWLRSEVREVTQYAILRGYLRRRGAWESYVKVVLQSRRSIADFHLPDPRR